MSPPADDRAKRRRFLLAAAVVGFSLLGLSLISILPKLLIPPGAKELPDIAFNTIDGRTLDPESLAGRPLLVKFWATSCAVCLHEIPDIEALYREFAPAGFEVIAVAASWDLPDAVVILSRRRALPWPVVLDPDGSIEKRFGGIDATPTHFFITPDGRVAFRRLGALDTRALAARLRTILD
ncbi:MAG: TlpA family protein disulfide reductase [Ectothiorhodospiraceae bacterium AqS1]|nr:TlpA family protein disulfide reductase [Ectothiorhodospiraceae bacterium AqS1]